MRAHAASIVLMERASLHEALAPCGTLATVAPRTGPDGRAETFAAALERVAAAAPQRPEKRPAIGPLPPPKKRK